MSSPPKEGSGHLLGDDPESTWFYHDGSRLTSSQLPRTDTAALYTPHNKFAEKPSQARSCEKRSRQNLPSPSHRQQPRLPDPDPHIQREPSSSDDKEGPRVVTRDSFESSERIQVQLACLPLIHHALNLSLDLQATRRSFTFEGLDAKGTDIPENDNSLSTSLDFLFPSFKVTNLLLKRRQEKNRGAGYSKLHTLTDQPSMSSQDLSGYRAVKPPEPSLPTVKMATLCREEVFGGCKWPDCQLSHELSLIEEIESQRHSRATIGARETLVLRNSPRAASVRNVNPDDFLDPPADHSPRGPRHDNDFLKVEDISLLPTTDEILSCRPSFLPEKDRCFGAGAELDNSGVQRLAGLLFRHLRFDALESAMDAVYTSLQLVLRRGPAPAPGLPFRQETSKGAKFSLFLDVTLDHFMFIERAGACVQASFPCPRELQGRGLIESGALEPGMLICLVTLYRVTGEVGTAFLQTVDRLPSDGREPPRAGVTATFADTEDIDKVRELLYAAHVHADGLVVGLVDCGGIMPAGFVHHLRRLRQFCSSANVEEFSKTSPLARALLASQGGSFKTVPPPYSAKPDFVWNLRGLPRPISTAATAAAAAMASAEPLLLRAGVDKGVAIEMIRRASTLDEGQVDALYNNLTRELAFTQGPPGTGKSFLATCTAKVLLDSLVQAERGPLLVVTQTNHSLDDALEALLERGVRKLVRLGAGSKSAKLIERHILRDLARRRKLTAEEKSQSSLVERRMHARLEAGQILAAAWLSSSSKSSRGESSYQQASTAIPAWQNFVVRGITTATATSLPFRPAPTAQQQQPETEAGGSSQPAGSESKQARRMAAKNQFKCLTIPQQCDAFAEFHRRYHVARQEYLKLKDVTDANTMREQDVVGLTSTGVASMSGSILKLKPKILLLEEASELTEAHTLCTLFPSIEHIIAIGDPWQLRPYITERVLCSEASPLFRLDESLFERLVKINFPFSRLTVQRRAHPNLAALVQATDYPFLTHHPSTAERDPVRGMYDRLQWMMHELPETFGLFEGLNSYTNQFEAEYIRELARWLTVGKKYRIGQVVVLTPYNGQVALLKALFSEVPIEYYLKDYEISHILAADLELGSEFGVDDGDIESELEYRAKRNLTVPINLEVMVRITSIDNYQGEEAPVIIFSPVRSNRQNKIGFLSIRNRINVAISRARNGFFIIGNCRLLATNSEAWTQVANGFINHGSLDSGILIECLDHPQDAYKVKSHTPWSFFPEHEENRCPKCKRGAPKEEFDPTVMAVLEENSRPAHEKEDEQLEREQQRQQEEQRQLQQQRAQHNLPLIQAPRSRTPRAILDEPDDYVGPASLLD